MQEQVMHVDGNDKALGCVTRDEAHAKKLRHRSGVVIRLDQQGRVFLAVRSKEKKIFGGMIDFACSFHVKHGESYEAAARRELKEEAGITDEPRFLGTTRCDSPVEPLNVAVFTSRLDGQDILKLTEATGGEWHSLEEADERIKTEPCAHWVGPAWHVFRNA